MKYFVEENSVVREIWGKSDTILFIFAGASAEFALNKAVDWLYFTSKLPSDPIGRLFSTVRYAKKIVFASFEEANKTIDTMSHIHTAVEKKRGSAIPEWAYHDVLYMLIYYSIASYELLENELNPVEKEEVYNVFYRVGLRMGVKQLPSTYNEWIPVRHIHLMEDLKMSEYTADLFNQYKFHLGPIRYRLLIESQKLVVPRRVIELLNFSKLSLLTPLLPVYKISRWLKMDHLIKNFLFPADYISQINELDG